MHGIPAEGAQSEQSSMYRPIADWFTRHRNWCLIVLLPTFVVAAYYYLIAADQYESEAHFVVRSSNAPQPSPSGIGQALTMVGATSSQSDEMIVSDYLTSHDAVDALQSRVDLVKRFRRPEADFISQLWSAHPTPERLLDYYLGKIDVKVHSDSGITTLQVRSFRSADSVAIINSLLQLSEDRVNLMNKRNYDAAVSVAQRQLDAAEANVAATQRQVTSFRESDGDFNPQTTGQARVGLIAQLQGRLADARAQESAMASAVSSQAPQLVAIRARVAALAQQVAVEQNRLANGPGNVATGLGTYEGIQVRQQFAAKRYDAAASAVQKAREEAAKQQLFLVKVVAPNVPVKSLYPKRGKTVFTIFAGLLLAYGIGWLILAGVKEHAA